MAVVELYALMALNSQMHAARVAPEEQGPIAPLPAAASFKRESAMEADMANKTYAEKLRDPRWQRRRLEILNRSSFTCEVCEASDKTLNVHHRLYRKGAEPWEYADDELQALCEECHEAHHALEAVLKKALAKLNIYELEQILGYARGMEARRQIEPSDLDGEQNDPSRLSFEIPSEDYACGFLDALWIEYTKTNLDVVIHYAPYNGLRLWQLHVEDVVGRVRRLRESARYKDS